MGGQTAHDRSEPEAAPSRRAISLPRALRNIDRGRLYLSLPFGLCAALASLTVLGSPDATLMVLFDLTFLTFALCAGLYAFQTRSLREGLFRGLALLSLTSACLFMVGAALMRQYIIDADGLFDMMVKGNFAIALSWLLGSFVPFLIFAAGRKRDGMDAAIARLWQRSRF